jgi:hypothetical protein
MLPLCGLRDHYHVPPWGWFLPSGGVSRRFAPAVSLAGAIRRITL